MDTERLIELRDFYRTALVEDSVAFWSEHGMDRQEGGFFTHLERDGRVYCTDKPVWFMGRATWLYATLYGAVERRPEWLETARQGYEFLNRHCFAESGKMFFSVTRTGQPLQMRRYAFSEVFGVMACAALGQVTGEERIRQQAKDLFESLVHYFRTPGAIEPKIDPQTRPMKGLSPLMCLVSVAETMLLLGADQRYENIITETVEEILRDFVRADDGVVLETVSPDGSRLDTPAGRVMSPGHSIETAWFLMEVARRRNDESLARQALQILDFSYEKGWDQQYGGLLYYIDVEGKPPQHLEHDMKLWWPHSEALYALLLAYRLTGENRYANMYEKVHEWTFANFPDAEYGEWFGYLRRDGIRSTDLKGNMWKGPFHVPRALMLCWKLLCVMTTDGDAGSGDRQEA